LIEKKRKPNKTQPKLLGKLEPEIMNPKRYKKSCQCKKKASPSGSAIPGTPTEGLRQAQDTHPTSKN